jgi:SAM-dependent methyltransferase
MPKVMFSRLGRYECAAEILKGRRGTVLDIGARHGVMRQHLDPTLTYRTADRSGEHDFNLNLEVPLEMADRSFDYTIALDVIEHVDNIHGALHEILRITNRSSIISLPSMAGYTSRLRFLLSGSFATDKYDLPVEPVDDRHRWLTTARDILPFYEEAAQKCGFYIEQLVWEADGGRVGRRASLALLRARLLPISLLTRRATACFTRLEYA